MQTLAELYAPGDVSEGSAGDAKVKGKGRQVAKDALNGLEDVDEEEDEVTGRLGRFSRRFGDLGGEGEKTGMEWMDEASGSEVATHAAAGEGKAKGKK